MPNQFTLVGQYIANTFQWLLIKPDKDKEYYYNGLGATVSYINLDPVGTVKMYHPYPISSNYTADFNPLTGLGVVGGAWEHFAICDGRNGTPDLRGQQIP